MVIHLRTRLPYGITQYYLPPNTCEHTPLCDAAVTVTSNNNMCGCDGCHDMGFSWQLRPQCIFQHVVNGLWSRLFQIL